MKNYLYTLFLFLVLNPLSFAQPAEETPLGSNFKVEGESGARFKSVEVTSLPASDAATTPQLIGENIGRDEKAAKVIFVNLEVQGETNAQSGAQAEQSLRNTLQAQGSEATYQAKSVSLEVSPTERTFATRLNDYQKRWARPTWTVIKCVTYTFASWYLVFRSSGYVDYWMPTVTVALAAFFAWKVEAVNKTIENFKPVFSAINRLRAGTESLAKKVSLAITRLVEPLVVTTVFETFLYYGILQCSDFAQSQQYPHEHVARSFHDIFTQAAHYGTRAFFSDYAMALAIQKKTTTAAIPAVYKKAIIFHTGILLSMATFLGNFADGAGKTWAAPMMITMTAAGTLAYLYVKLPVVKALLAAWLRFVPGVRHAKFVEEWIAQFDAQKDFLSDVVDDDVKLAETSERTPQPKVSGCKNRLTQL